MSEKRTKLEKMAAIIIRKEHNQAGDKGLVELLNALEAEDGISMIKKYIAPLSVMLSIEATNDPRIALFLRESNPLRSLQATSLYATMTDMLVEYLHDYTNDMENFFSQVMAAEASK